jgi:GH24 family phage-related lysozyme (muramidase)
MIRASVLQHYHEFSEPLEGRVHSMYLDVKGLVTTGVGNLIDTPEQACALPWRHETTGKLAERPAIAQAWRAVKDARPALHWRQYLHLNDLRLSDSDVDALVQDKLLSNARYIQAKHYPRWEDFPADAQLGIMSMAWAVGPGFPAKFGNFTNRVLQEDWLGAKACCHIRTEGNPGIVPRNHANERCFENAALVLTRQLDPAVLYWPGQPPDTMPAPPPELTLKQEADAAKANFDPLDAAHDERVEQLKEP